MKLAYITKSKITKDMKKLYVMYCRKSSESEDRQAASIEDQSKVLQELAKDTSISIVKTFSEAKSAKAPGRLQFDEMIKFITNRDDIKGIIAWKLNRLSRNPKDSGLLQWMLQEETIDEIVTPTKIYTQIDSDLLMSLENAVSNKFIRDLRTDTIRGLKSKIDRGIAPIKATVGYYNDTSKPQGQRDILPSDSFPLIRKLFKLALTREYSVIDLVNIAKEIGIRNSRGNPMSKSALHQVLHNPFYCGKFLYDGILYQGSHKKMISEAEFDLLQDIYGTRIGKSEKHNFTFNNLIKCACGGWYSADSKTKQYKNGTSQRFVYYRCSRKNEGCQRFYVKEENLQIQVNSFLETIKIKQHYIDWFIKWLNYQNKEKLDIRNAQRKALETNLNNVNKQIDELLTLKLSPNNIDGCLLTEDEYASKRQKLIKTKKELEGADNGKERYFESVDDLTAETFNFAARAKKTMAGKDIHKKKILLRAIGANLTIIDKKIDITPRYPFERIKVALRVINSCEPKETLLEGLNQQYFQFSKTWGD